MKKFIFLLTLLLAGLAPLSALAAPTFGAEFTMTSQTLINAPLLYPTTDDDISTEYGRRLIGDFARLVAEKCGECRVVPLNDRYDLPAYKVTMPQNFSFMITLDPAVMEIVPDAATKDGFKKLEPLLQSLVFEIGKSLQQTPHVSYGGGHVHLGIDSSFEGNPVLFRNFFVDWLNHPDLMASFTGSTYNSPTVYDLPSANAEREMRAVIAEFDERLRAEGFLENPERDPKRGFELMVELAQSIQKRVYTRTIIQTWTPPEKYQALNVTRLADPQVPREQKTIELRFFAGQNSVSEFIELIELFEGRIEHLKTSKGVITYEPFTRYTPEETARRLDRFAREAGTTSSAVRSSVQRKTVADLIPVPRLKVRCEAVFSH